MTNLIDSYLLFRLKTKRDPEAFARLYDRYVEAIYRYTVLKVPRKEDAQDITAETFTRAWQYILSEAPNITHIRALFYRIARNLIVDHYRKTGQHTAEEVVTFSVDAASSLLEDQSDRGQGARAVEVQADATLLLQKLERLKEDYRDVLTLRLVDDLPFAVIAEILEKNVGHVRVIYHRALKALQEIQ